MRLTIIFLVVLLGCEDEYRDRMDVDIEAGCIGCDTETETDTDSGSDVDSDTDTDTDADSDTDADADADADTDSDTDTDADTDTDDDLPCSPSERNEGCVMSVEQQEICIDMGGTFRSAPNCACCVLP